MNPDADRRPNRALAVSRSDRRFPTPREVCLVSWFGAASADTPAAGSPAGGQDRQVTGERVRPRRDDVVCRAAGVVGVDLAPRSSVITRMDPEGGVVGRAHFSAPTAAAQGFISGSFGRGSRQPVRIDATTSVGRGARTPEQRAHRRLPSRAFVDAVNAHRSAEAAITKAPERQLPPPRHAAGTLKPLPHNERRREQPSTPPNRVPQVKGIERGGGGNRTCPNRLEPSGTVGLQRKVSAGGVNLPDS